MFMKEPGFACADERREKEKDCPLSILERVKANPDARTPRKEGRECRSALKRRPSGSDDVNLEAKVPELGCVEDESSVELRGKRTHGSVSK